ncbi:Phage regulatory protein Rha (Phage_pRha) [Devosia equisanguinis]|uniref:Phage regulatory protein Rha (Phage_pRha) n=1 Tax=Devosia equisanguinis TaxID=2490941 RepID=A0A447IAK5_9HYPH|nr:Rha family transcriptional regulator [Devosia equisanguinis]VDS04561.1 Phage regulatory protein Rha (Phage_pRha) [Devosia equisanguinis]
MADTAQLTMFEAMQLIEISEDRAVVTSLDVAQRFSKEHRNVIRAIQDLECSAEFRALNFEQSSYRTAQNRPLTMFKMTRDGFSLLVMGFTGAEAARWKERYIQAFNLLEQEALRRTIERAEARGRSKTVRVAATDSYKAHGASDWTHYVANTDAIYEIMFGGSAYQLRKKWGLPGNANVRDHLSTDQLNTVIQIEAAVTLQLDARHVWHPSDQLKIIRAVATSYRAMIEAPMPDLLTSQMRKPAA